MYYLYDSQPPPPPPPTHTKHVYLFASLQIARSTNTISDGTSTQSFHKRIGSVQRTFIKQTHSYSIGLERLLEHFFSANWAIRKSLSICLFYIFIHLVWCFALPHFLEQKKIYNIADALRTFEYILYSALFVLCHMCLLACACLYYVYVYVCQCVSVSPLLKVIRRIRLCDKNV